MTFLFWFVVFAVVLRLLAKLLEGRPETPQERHVKQADLFARKALEEPSKAEQHRRTSARHALRAGRGLPPTV